MDSLPQTQARKCDFATRQARSETRSGIRCWRIERWKRVFLPYCYRLPRWSDSIWLGHLYHRHSLECQPHSLLPSLLPRLAYNQQCYLKESDALRLPSSRSSIPAVTTTEWGAECCMPLIGVSSAAEVASFLVVAMIIAWKPCSRNHRMFSFASKVIVDALNY